MVDFLAEQMEEILFLVACCCDQLRVTPASIINIKVDFDAVLNAATFAYPL